MACPYVRMPRGLESTQVGQRLTITTARSIVRFRLCVQVNPQIVSELVAARNHLAPHRRVRRQIDCACPTSKWGVIQA